MFGVRLCFLRCRAGLTQAELGKWLNLSSSALGMYEQGKRTPSLSVIVAISGAFHVTTQFLLTGQGMNAFEKSLVDELAHYTTIEESIPAIYTTCCEQDARTARIRRLISQGYEWKK